MIRILSIIIAMSLAGPVLARAGGDLHNRQSPCSAHPDTCLR